MANPFGYTRSTSVTTPNSARISVTPSVGATDAFKNLQGLVNAGIQFQQDQVNRETEALTLETQYLRMQEADYQTVINERLDEIQTETLNDWNALASSRQQKVMEAGIDLGANAQILEEFSDNLDISYDSLPPEVKKSLVTTYNRFKEQGQADYNSVYQTNRKNNYLENIDTLAVTTLQMDPAERAATQNAWVAKAERFGFSKSEISQRLFDNGLNYLLVNAVDEESLNNYDYSGIHLVEQYIDDAVARDPKLANKPAHLRALATLKTTKNEIDSGLRSALSAAVTNVDVPTVEYLTTVALAEGAISEQEAYNFGMSLARKQLSSSTKPEAQVAKLIEINGYQPIWRQDDNLQSAYTNAVQQEITTQLNSPTPDLKLMRQLAENDPSVYKPVINKAINSTQKTIMSVMSAEGGTPEEQAARSEQLGEALREYQKFQEMTFGPMTDEQRLTDSVIRLTQQGLVPDTRHALEVFNSEARDSLVSTADPNVRKLKEELPALAATKAVQEYSAFMNMGIDKDTAFDEAKRLNGLGGVSGAISAVTDSTIANFAGRGISEEKIKYVEQVLTDPTNESIPNDFRASVTQLLDESGAVIEVDDNYLIFRSDENPAGLRIPMTEENWRNLKDAVNELYDIDNEVGLTGAVASDIGDVVADGVHSTYSFWATAGDLLVSPSGPIGKAGEAFNQMQTFVGDVQAELVYVDKLNLDLYEGRIDSEEYKEKLATFNREQAERRLLEAGKRRGLAEEETQRRIDAFFEAAGDTWMGRTIGSVYDSIFN